ncbi:uncharacterized protein L3040_009136 [Drepanopeziza brunnea f. sp. 'multigermtubi']|uniref:uncharacterized protein n=1 Tax=Drepanopeziza brunnea f. sp. 'multigermtubi' TaxID=698441 RepID=UPI0023A434D8|nr:hypothetical protein L3040_009136 [Drepanopeziza brunnea f. sp. 'multigermtubi']
MASPARSSAPGIRPLPESPKESAISRLLITPLAFLSFILSLALVDSRNHSLRTHSHSPSRAPPTTLLGRVRFLLHGLIFKEVSGGPYSYVRSPDAREKEKEKGSPGAGDRGANGKGRKKGKEEPWHWHTKQRKMMRAEMEDAFKLRKWLMGVRTRWVLKDGGLAMGEL